MKLVAALGLLLLVKDVVNGVKIDPALMPILEPFPLTLRSEIAETYYPILITFVENVSIKEKLFVSRAEQAIEIYPMLRDQNEHAIQNLEREMAEIKHWEPVRAYAVSNSWLIKGTKEVIKYLASKQGVIAEIHWDRPFKVPQHVVKEQVPMEGSHAGLQADQKIEAFLLHEKNRKMEEDAISEWNIRYMGASDTWDITTGTDMIYASADTGVEWTHPILAPRYVANLWYPQGPIRHDYAWWDGIRSEGTFKALQVENGAGMRGKQLENNKKSFGCPPNGKEPCDDCGHGTHTTSTAVGKQSQIFSSGTGGYGVAPGAYWMACRNMDNGVGSTSTYLNCLEFFLAPTDLEGNNPDPSKRPHVIGNSYGCPQETEGCASWAFNKAISALRAAGIVMVASAGNTGPKCGSISAPPSYEPEVISVGATQYYSDEIAPFSSRGLPAIYLRMSSSMHRFKPDIVAPGVVIRGAYKNGSYMTLSGTSMAAPHVAGAILLISAACPHLARNVIEIEKLILRTTKKLYVTCKDMLCGSEAIGQHPNSIYGHGILSVEHAVQACLSLD